LAKVLHKKIIMVRLVAHRTFYLILRARE
jgi:hypothetical protein